MCPKKLTTKGGRHKGNSLWLPLLIAVVAGCYGGPPGTPYGLAGSAMSDTNRDRRPDLWLVYRGKALVTAAADTNFDGKPDAIIREEASGSRVLADSDGNGLYDFDAFAHGMRVEDFTRLAQGMVLDPLGTRPARIDLLQSSYDVRRDGTRDFEVLSRLDWCPVRYDRDNDGTYDTAAVYERGSLARIEMDLDNDGSNDLWGVFAAGITVRLKWLHAGKMYYWTPQEDKFGVDDDMNGVVDRIVAIEGTDVDDPLLLEIYNSLEAVRRRVAAR